ncbi:unnamed protein product [Peniophora sp. CBMAI 1063]|nr:unnamed protein product [Peniophora sp. CBMAI 1063]
MSSIHTIQLKTALKDAREALPAVILGSYLFGVFTLLVAFSIHILRRKGIRTRAYAAMLILIVLMYLLAATSWAILASVLLRVVEDPQEYAHQEASALIIKDKTLQWCLGLNIFMSDIILAWRTWSLWSDSRKRTWIGGIAIILLFATAVAGTADLGIYSLHTVIPDQQNDGALGYDNVPSVLYANFSGDISVVFSAILNVLCVLFTATKIQQLKILQRSIDRRLSNNRIGRILFLLVSCELVYCIFWIYWVAISFRDIGSDIPDLNVTLLMCNNTVAVQINGIMPTFVIVCVSLQQVNAHDEMPSSPSPAFRCYLHNGWHGSL